MVATAVALCTYALGNFLAFGRLHDHQAATQRVAAGVRRFVIAHLPRSDTEQKVAVSVAELERLLELADACERTVGQPPPPLHLARRVLQASAQRRSGSTQRIAA
jgi:hypothetical protein